MVKMGRSAIKKEFLIELTCRPEFHPPTEFSYGRVDVRLRPFPIEERNDRALLFRQVMREQGFPPAMRISFQDVTRPEAVCVTISQPLS